MRLTVTFQDGMAQGSDIRWENAAKEAKRKEDVAAASAKKAVHILLFRAGESWNDFFKDPIKLVNLFL